MSLVDAAQIYITSVLVHSYMVGTAMFEWYCTALSSKGCSGGTTVRLTVCERLIARLGGAVAGDAEVIQARLQSSSPGVE